MTGIGEFLVKLHIDRYSLYMHKRIIVTTSVIMITVIAAVLLVPILYPSSVTTLTTTIAKTPKIITQLANQTTQQMTPVQPMKQVKNTVIPTLVIKLDKTSYDSEDKANISVETNTPRTIPIIFQYQNKTVINTLLVKTDMVGRGNFSLTLPIVFGHGSFQAAITGTIKNTTTITPITIKQKIPTITVQLESDKTVYSAPGYISLKIKTMPPTENLMIPIHFNMSKTFHAETGPDGTVTYGSDVLAFKDGLLTIDSNDTANHLSSNMLHVIIDNSQYYHCQTSNNCNNKTQPIPQSIPDGIQSDKLNYSIAMGQSIYVKITGKSSSAAGKQPITITFTYPDGTQQDTRTITNREGSFNTFLLIDSTSQKGTYKVDAFYNSILQSSTSFQIKPAG